MKLQILGGWLIGVPAKIITYSSQHCIDRIAGAAWPPNNSLRSDANYFVYSVMLKIIYRLAKILHFVCLVFISNNIYSQAPSIEWQKCYGGPGSERSRCIQPTTDGGSIASGDTRFSAGFPGDVTSGYVSFDIWVTKLDGSGNLQWQKTLGGNGDDASYSLQQTLDGGYIIAGSTSSTNGDISINHGGYDYWIIKLSNTGTIEWQKTFGGSGNEQPSSIQQTTDGGYIVAGQTLSGDGDVTGYHGNLDYWILKLDNIGNLIWQKALGGSEADVATGIKQTFDGGYIVGGSTASTDGDVINTYNATGSWIIKLNGMGIIEWQKTYGNVFGSAGADDICILSDGSYAFIDGCYNNGGDITGHIGLEDFWVVKISNTGNIIWQKPIGGTSSDVPIAITPTGDGGCLAMGYTNSNNGDATGYHGGTDFLIAKLSADGILEWAKALGGDADDRPYAGYQTNNNAYIVAGVSGSNNNGDVGSNHGGGDFWVVKLSFNATPVTLAAFAATPQSQDVFCKWETLQEQNSSHFVIERSSDALHFAEMGRVKAAGNSTLPIDYHFVDQNALQVDQDYLYYRLRMVDLDGSFKNSDVVKIRLKASPAFSIYPNPVANVLNIDLTSAINEEAIISITDHTGKKLYQKGNKIKQGKNIIVINTNFLPGGAYILSVKGGNNYSARFVKQNN